MVSKVVDISQNEDMYSVGMYRPGHNNNNSSPALSLEEKAALTMELAVVVIIGGSSRKLVCINPLPV